MNDRLLLRPVAYIESDFTEKFGVPRQSGRVKDLRAAVVFTKEFSVDEAFRGIDGYSHLWLIWGFSLNAPAPDGGWSPTVRPPRLGGNKRMGVFATRSPNRPNPLGLSLVELIEIKKTSSGIVLIVGGADLVSGTPVYDVKPYLPASDAAENVRGGFADEFTGYALEVDFPPELAKKLPPGKQRALTAVLREDPRPSYQDDGRTYGLSFAGCEISFFVDREGVLHVTDVR